MDYLQYLYCIYISKVNYKVLNLIINGLPSIPKWHGDYGAVCDTYSFKPYYKWITFNTYKLEVLWKRLIRFKPYYKWITFNTED